MLNEEQLEEQVIDVEAVDVEPEMLPATGTISVDDLEFGDPTPPAPNPYYEYVDFKKQTYKYKQLRKQVQNNIKSQRGFGYTYQEISYDN